MGISSDIIKELVTILKPITSAKVVTSFVDSFFNDIDGLTKNQVVINSKMVPSENFTFSDTTFKSSSTITIEVFAKTTKDCIEIAEEVQEALINARGSMLISNLRFGDTTMATVTLGAKTMKILPIPISFECYWEVENESSS
jgi:hypothetical protein